VVHGNGEPLLMINGLADDLTSWAVQIEEFACHYRLRKVCYAL
jgi:hypothetical protein